MCRTKEEANKWRQAPGRTRALLCPVGVSENAECAGRLERGRPSGAHLLARLAPQNHHLSQRQLQGTCHQSNHSTFVCELEGEFSRGEGGRRFLASAIKIGPAATAARGKSLGPDGATGPLRFAPNATDHDDEDEKEMHPINLCARVHLGCWAGTGSGELREGSHKRASQPACSNSRFPSPSRSRRRQQYQSSRTWTVAHGSCPISPASRESRSPAENNNQTA